MLLKHLKVNLSEQCLYKTKHFLLPCFLVLSFNGNTINIIVLIIMQLLAVEEVVVVGVVLMAVVVSCGCRCKEIFKHITGQEVTIRHWG